MEKSDTQKGPVLFIVATPIGTLSDLSPHAKEVLGSVDFVLCEDTRHTGRLLMAADIRTKLVSLHDHNEKERSTALVADLHAAPRQMAAIVTDAGTPCISDPGSHFVRIARESGVRIRSVPGPSALAAALAVSGFARPRSIFSGFLARSEKEQRSEFVLWQRVAPCIAVCFESPRRLLATLSALENHFGGETEICLAREISKAFEEQVSGKVADVRSLLSQRSSILGECVLVVDVKGPCKTANLGSDEEGVAETSLEKLAEMVIADRGDRKLKQTVKEFAEKHGVDSGDLYSAVLHKQRLDT